MAALSRIIGRACILNNRSCHLSVIPRSCLQQVTPLSTLCLTVSQKQSLSTTHHPKVSAFQSKCNSCSPFLSAYLKGTRMNISSRNYASEIETQQSDRGELVYQGRVGSMFKMLKLFSLTTSGIGLSLQPYLFITYQDAPLVTAVPFFAALNMFVFVNPFLIHYIGKKYVMEVYFNRESKVFTAVLMTFFARKYSFTFTADDVKVPDVPGLFAILNVKDRPLFVLESDFTDIEVYKHMMGFDKPLDLTFLQEDDKQEK